MKFGMKGHQERKVIFCWLPVFLSDIERYAWLERVLRIKNKWGKDIAVHYRAEWTKEDEL